MSGAIWNAKASAVSFPEPVEDEAAVAIVDFLYDLAHAVEGHLRGQIFRYRAEQRELPLSFWGPDVVPIWNRRLIQPGFGTLVCHLHAVSGGHRRSWRFRMTLLERRNRLTISSSRRA